MESAGFKAMINGLTGDKSKGAKTDFIKHSIEFTFDLIRNKRSPELDAKIKQLGEEKAVTLTILRLHESVHISKEGDLALFVNDPLRRRFVRHMVTDKEDDLAKYDGPFPTAGLES